MWVTNDFFKAKKLEIEYWSNITSYNQKKLEKVWVIWQDIVLELFWWENPVWKKVKLWNNIFYIVWVLKENSTYWSYMFIPITTSSIRITWQKYYSQIMVSVSDSTKITEKQEEIDKLLQKELKITDTTSLPYRIRNQSEMLSNMSSITTTLTMLLSWIAWISLLVWWIMSYEYNARFCKWKN